MFVLNIDETRVLLSSQDKCPWRSSSHDVRYLILI